MTAARLHQLLLDAGIAPDDVTRLTPVVFVRISGFIPHANGPHAVQLTHEATILTPALTLTTSHSGLSGPVDAEQAHALVDLETRYAAALTIVEKVLADHAEEAVSA